MHRSAELTSHSVNNIVVVAEELGSHIGTLFRRGSCHHRLEFSDDVQCDIILMQRLQDLRSLLTWPA